MITAEDLKPPPVEYWQNVYWSELAQTAKLGLYRFGSRHEAITNSELTRPIYRIHVRLK